MRKRSTKMTITTIVDVIEEELGAQLSGSSRQSLEKLSNKDFASLGRALYNFSRAEWMRIPHPEADKPCFAPHPDSELTNFLGGTGMGLGLKIPFSPEYMTGAAVVALTYLPRVAVNDGIQYFLDYYDYFNSPSNEHRETIINVLLFYGMSRELIQSGNLIIIPRTIWLKHSVSRGNSPVVDDAFLIESLKSQNLIPEIKYENHPIYSQSQIQQLALDSIIGDSKKEIEYLLQFCSGTRYSPLLTSRKQEITFNSLIDPWTMGPVQASSSVQRASVALPTVGRIGISEFLAAREADGFNEFRKSFDEIGLLSSRQDIGPIELEQGMKEILKEGHSRVEKSIQASSFLSSLWVNSAKVGAAVLGGTVATGAIKPEWADDPWKLLVAGGVSGTFELVLSEFENMKKKSKKRKISSLYATLIPELNGSES